MPVTGLDGKTYPKPKPKPQPRPARPVTFGVLKRKLRDLNRIADECLAMAEEFEFDDKDIYAQYGDTEEDLAAELQDLADELAAELQDLADELKGTVEQIVEAIDEGRL